MNTILSFMDKLYSDSKTLSIVYMVGAILLFIFILLLMFSLRKNDKKDKTIILEEPSIEEVKTESVVETKPEEPIEEETVKEIPKEETNTIDQSIFEKTKIIPLDELKKAEDKKEDLGTVLNNVDNYKKPEELEEEKADPAEKISSEIPSIDEFVDNVVKKTYEKNEQFSSVYVENNTSAIKLDKVMENLNVDEAVKESIIPDEEKTEEKVVEEPEITVPIAETVDENVTVQEEKDEAIQEDTNNSLDNLKKALEEKKKEVNLKQDELKAKLEGLKQPKITTDETVKAEELLNKLNDLKEK